MTTMAQGSITGMRTVGVPVKDQGRALDFYTGTLGLDVQLDMPIDELGTRWIEVAPPGGGTSIALVAAGDSLPTGVETGIRLTTPDAAALHRELAAHDVDVGELLNWPGVPPMFAFRDPDGNGLEIVQAD
jgi:lactoylglutathione lyase